MKKKYEQKTEINFKKIEEIRFWLGYSDVTTFAKDCGITYPTYLAVKVTGSSGLKFLKWLIKLVKEKENKDLTISYFFK